MPNTNVVVELKPRPSPTADAELLGSRLRQQSILTDFGWRALETSNLDELFEDATSLCGEGVGADFCKLLQFLPDRNRLLVRAGFGWKPGVVGVATLGADLGSPSGYAFRTGSPVISNHLEHERRFRTPPLLVDHEVRRAINVPIALSQGHLWGVLSADSRDEGCFDEADIEFMQGMAHSIGAAIERDQARRHLEASADLLKHSDDPVIVWTLSDGIESWSEGAAELYGYTEEEALHRPPAELLGTSFPVPWSEIVEQLRTRGSWEGELVKHGKGGREAVLWSRLRMVVDPDGTERVLEVSRDITDRKRMEDALRAAEARFRSLYEAQQTAHLVLAPDLTIEAASPAYLDATMTRAEDLVGRNIFDAFPDNPDDPRANGVRNLAASLQRVRDMRRPDRMPVQKYDIRLPDGRFHTRWWAPLNVPVFAPDGSLRNIIHQVEDVTGEMLERQKTAAAEAREERLRTVTEAIPALLLEADTEGHNTYVNGPFAAFIGQPPDALLGEGWIDFLHPDDRERVCHLWRHSIGSGTPYEQEFRLRGANGEWRWFLTRANPIRDASGAVEKWIGVCSDIDVAKHAEAALREREEQFRSMAEALPQLAWMADEKGWIYWYNRRWYDYTGTTLEEMQGWGWRKVHHPDHVERVVERIQHSWDTGEPWEDTFPLRGADGEYRWFLSRAEPLRDAEGRVTRWFGTNTDITEQRKLEDLQRLMMSEISHRVKNSLSLVSSLLGLQARTLEDGPRLALEDASARVRAVATVHDQLWRQADARAVDLARFLPNLAGAVATTAPKHDTIVEVEPATVSAEMAVSLGLFVNELLTNAYKYAYPEGEEGEVRVTGTPGEDGRYRLEVSDRGRGLPEGFDLAGSSTSLGMRVITTFAAQLGGTLAAGSADPGACFALEFPLENGTSPNT